MQALKDFLQRSKISQAELARQVGVSQPTVWEWLEGKCKPSADNLIALSNVTGVSIDRLLADKRAHPVS